MRVGGGMGERNVGRGMGIVGGAVQRRAHSGFPSDRRSREYAFEDVSFDFPSGMLA